MKSPPHNRRICRLVDNDDASACGLLFYILHNIAKFLTNAKKIPHFCRISFNYLSVFLLGFGEKGIFIATFDCIVHHVLCFFQAKPRPLPTPLDGIHLITELDHAHQILLLR